jgi:hypothetical protein
MTDVKIQSHNSYRLRKRLYIHNLITTANKTKRVISNGVDNKRRTTTTKKTAFGLAIDNYVLKEIRKESEAKGLSINAKINAILTKHVDYDRHTESLRCIHISNKRFKSLLDNIDEVNLLEGFKADMTDIVPTAHIEQNTPATLDGLIKYFFQNIGLNAGLYQNFSYFKGKDDRLYFAFKHDFGIKWSRVLSAGFIHLIENTLKYHARCAKILPSSVADTRKKLGRY